MGDSSRFDQWYHDQTVIHPVGLAAWLVLAVAVLMLRRRYALIPLIALASLIPSAQRILVFGLDLTLVRLLLVVGLVRILLRNEHRGFRWLPVDLAFLAWILVGGLIYTIRVGTSSAVILKLGSVFEALAIYFYCRLVVQSWTDLARVSASAALLAAVSGVFFVLEATTGRNLFSVFGGVPEFTGVREGRLRCQGPFPHAILAGVFWATLLPLVGVRWWNPSAGRITTAWAILSILVIVITTASSTPILTVAAVVVAACFFPWRLKLRWVRWAAVATVVGLHLVMTAPVWHLIARVNLVGGSTGWHRYHLIDQFIRNADEWWLLGTNSTAHWGWQLQDTANVYVTQGVQGGLLTLLLMLTTLAFAFRQNGLTLRNVRGDRVRTAYAWALGVSLFAHSVAMIGVSYRGPILVAWYGTFALVASLATAPIAAPVGVRGRPARGSKRSPPWLPEGAR